MSCLTISDLIRQVKASVPVAFEQVMAVIDAEYRYRACRFRNGVGADALINEAGTNEGSCKIFYFSRLMEFDEQQTLALFGDYYRRDVLMTPEGVNHANIRRFMRDGWPGVVYEGVPLVPRGIDSAQHG
jgi:hypothetical protein